MPCASLYYIANTILRFYRYPTMPTYNLSTFPSIAFSFRIATSVSVPVSGAQPTDVGSVAAVDGMRIAGGGRSLAWLSAVAGG